MYEFLDYLTEDAMTSDVVTLPRTARVEEAEALFDKHHFNGAPVLDESGRFVGWLTKLDLLRAFRFTDEHMFPPYEEIMRQSIEPLMKTDIFTATPRTPLTRVLERLVSARVKSLPVVEDGRVVGVISREDVLRALQRAAGRDGKRAGA